MFEGTGLVVPPFAELPAGGRVTRWKLVPGVTSKDAVGVAVFALAGSVSAFGKGGKMSGGSQQLAEVLELPEPSAAARFNLAAASLDLEPLKSPAL